MIEIKLLVKQNSQACYTQKGKVTETETVTRIYGFVSLYIRRTGTDTKNKHLTVQVLDIHTHTHTHTPTTIHVILMIVPVPVTVSFVHVRGFIYNI